MFPNFEEPVNSLLLAIAQLGVLSILMVGLNNKLKEIVSDETKKYFFLVAILMGIVLVVVLSSLWYDAFPLSIGQSIFFGFFVGLTSVGLYEAGLGKKKDNTTPVETDPTNPPEEIPSGGFDRPDARDYHYEALAGSDTVVARPTSMDLGADLAVQNQVNKHTPSTSMACNAYGFGHAVNANNKFDDGNVYVKCNELRASFYIKYGPVYEANGVNMLTQGSAKQDMLSFGKSLELVIAYFLCKSADEICENIARHRAIHTGSMKIDFTATNKRADKIAVIGVGPAHIFDIEGYNDTKRLFKCKNSRGPDRGDHGYFYLRYEDFGALYTAHALFDFDDQPIVEAFMKIRNEILASATAKIARGEKLNVEETIALRNVGASNIIPK